MIPILDQNQCRLETMEAYSNVRRGFGTEQYKDFAKWIEALIAELQGSMTSCAKDKLPDIQVRVKQLMALRSALVDMGGAFTGYSFD